MITNTRLGTYGRLGNQLYQYAALRAAALRTGHVAAVPDRCLRHTHALGPDGENGLAGFRVEAYAYAGQPSGLVEWHEAPLGDFDPRFLTPPDGSDYVGYFQDLRYLAGAHGQLRAEFRFRADVADHAEAAVAPLRSRGEVVSVHVRRGDYVAQPGSFRVLTADELYAAAALFPGAAFLVSSDDPAWCRTRLDWLVPGRDVISPETCAWRAMAAMALCDHHVISASTFSWWAAWLCTRPGKRVLYPDPWFAGAAGEAARPPRHRHPAGWEPLPTDRKGD